MNLPNKPGFWLIKAICSYYDGSHYIVINCKEIPQSDKFYQEYLNNKQGLLYDPPPYVAFIANYIPTCGTIKSVVIGGSFIFHTFENWNYKSKEQFLEYSKGTSWIEEATFIHE